LLARYNATAAAVGIVWSQTKLCDPLLVHC
jgi:hypothetical protein